MFSKVAHALNDVAHAWELEKIALSAEETRRMLSDPTHTPGYRNSAGGRQLAEYMRRIEQEGKRDARFGRDTVARHYEDLHRKYPHVKRPGDVPMPGLSRGAKIGLGIGAGALAAGAGYGAYRMYKNRQEKKAYFMDAYDAEDFAKEAELRAAEILLANGIHPETLEDIQPEFAKLASFPSPELANDDDEFVAFSEMDEMLNVAAEHIINSLLD